MNAQGGARLLPSRAAAATVLWALDHWADKERAQDWRYWYMDDMSSDSSFAAVGWFVAWAGAGAATVLLLYGLSLARVMVAEAIWLPSLMFILAVTGCCVNAVRHLARNHAIQLVRTFLWW